MVPAMREPPYPADTRAKGWRLELDYEKIEQSDTWDLAAEIPMAQHALLMMWYVAWKQTPCGSLPGDEASIRAKCRVSAKLWPAMRDVLLRGWWLASDGRMYHDTIAERVQEMLSSRAKTAKRVATHKAKTREQPSGNALPTGDERDSNDTYHLPPTTGGVEPNGSTPPASGGDCFGEYIPPEGFDAALPGVRYGEVAGAIRRAGLAALDPGYPLFRALVDAGATAPEFIAFVDEALTKDQPFKWLIGAVSGERKRAAQLAGQIHRGPMPNRQEAQEQRNRAVGEAWLREQEAADASR